MRNSVVNVCDREKERKGGQLLLHLGNYVFRILSYSRRGYRRRMSFLSPETRTGLRWMDGKVLLTPGCVCRVGWDDFPPLFQEFWACIQTSQFKMFCVCVCVSVLDVFWSSSSSSSLSLAFPLSPILLSLSLPAGQRINISCCVLLCLRAAVVVVVKRRSGNAQDLSSGFIDPHQSFFFFSFFLSPHPLAHPILLLLPLDSLINRINQDVITT